MKVLFVCVENTCRSQMAEGFARAMGLVADSAGVKAGSGVNPTAVQVMNEVGIDISGYQSKAINYDRLGQFDVVISMCSVNTADVCPSTFIGTQENWDIDDPKGLPLDFFRNVRDLIREKVEALQNTS
jgi:arsenate reductase (thioredoxin)